MWAPIVVVGTVATSVLGAVRWWKHETRKRLENSQLNVQVDRDTGKAVTAAAG